MAVADLPAFLQTVREQTGAEKVALIGHSQGAVEILASLIDGHVLPTEVSGVVTLGPPAQLKNQQSKLFEMLGKMRVDDLAKKIPSKIFTPTLGFFNSAIGNLGFPYDALFQFIFGPSKLLTGSNFHNHFPAPTSGQNLAHWVQSARTGRFQHFEPNTLVNPATAPAYDPAAIPANSVKIATFIGGNDFLATKADIEGFLNPALESQGNLAKTQVFPGYAHMDFTWSLDAAKTVYPVVMDFLKTL
jgi:pimeloyl-ACP methyl ester carboxylesterase